MPYVYICHMVCSMVIKDVDLIEQSFYMVGGIDEMVAKAEKFWKKWAASDYLNMYFPCQCLFFYCSTVVKIYNNMLTSLSTVEETWNNM